MDLGETVGKILIFCNVPQHYGHTPNENGLLDLERVIHIFIMLKPKDAELIMIVQLICGTAV